MQFQKKIVADLHNPLPFSDIEHAASGGFYYKTIEHSYNMKEMKVRIGLKVTEINISQQDHLAFLMQMFNTKSKTCKIVLLGLENLFVESSYISIKFQTEMSSQYIIQQRIIFNSLKRCADSLAQIVNHDLSPLNLLSQLSSQQLLESKINQLIQRTDHHNSFSSMN